MTSKRARGSRGCFFADGTPRRGPLRHAVQSPPAPAQPQPPRNAPALADLIRCARPRTFGVEGLSEELQRVAHNPISRSALQRALDQILVTPEGNLLTANTLRLINEAEPTQDILNVLPQHLRPAARSLFCLTPKFIPRGKPLQMKGRLGLEKAMAALASRTLFAERRLRRREILIAEADAQRSLGLIPWSGKPPLPATRAQTRDLFNRLEASPALERWMHDLFDAGDDALSRAKRLTSADTIRARHPPNLTSAMRKVITLLREVPPGAEDTALCLAMADKGVGPCVYQNTVHTRHTMAHLLNPNTYQLLVSKEEGVDSLKAARSTIIKGRIRRVRAVLANHSALPPKLRWWFEASMGVAPNMAIRPTHALAKFYLIWKLHKKDAPLSARPIQPMYESVLKGVSDWVHTQLWKRVAAHPHILRNAHDWRMRAEELVPLRTQVGSDPLIVQYDVVALYPSIPHHHGLIAMQWFLDTFCTDMDVQMRSLIVQLTSIVIRDNYLEHPRVGILRQRRGTAMGTALSVVYANIFMLWFEHPIVTQYAAHLRLYTRYIDDGQLIIVAPTEIREQFLQAFNERLPEIKIDGITVGQRTEFLDGTTTLRLLRSDGVTNEWGFEFGVFRKPTHAFMYLPYTSAHSPTVFRAWLKAELTRYILLCSTREGFEREVRFLAAVLKKRGYPMALLRRCVSERGWAHAPEVRAAQAAATKRARQPPRPAEDPPVPYQGRSAGCVLTLPHVPLAAEWLRDPQVQRAIRIDQFVAPDSLAPMRAAVAWSNSVSLGSVLPRQR